MILSMFTFVDCPRKCGCFETLSSPSQMMAESGMPNRVPAAFASASDV
jgi:hypothetical protein